MVAHRYSPLISLCITCTYLYIYKYYIYLLIISDLRISKLGLMFPVFYVFYLYTWFLGIFSNWSIFFIDVTYQKIMICYYIPLLTTQERSKIYWNIVKIVLESKPCACTEFTVKCKVDQQLEIWSFSFYFGAGW